MRCGAPAFGLVRHGAWPPPQTRDAHSAPKNDRHRQWPVLARQGRYARVLRDQIGAAAPSAAAGGRARLFADALVENAVDQGWPPGTTRRYYSKLPLVSRNPPEGNEPRHDFLVGALGLALPNRIVAGR